MLYTIKLNDNKDFVRLYNKGAFVVSPFCTVYYRKNGKNRIRMGISTGKKIGNAVKRSRARRVIRQAYMENEASIPTGYDIVISARTAATTCKSYNISKFFRTKVIPAMNNPEMQKKQAKK